MAVTKMTIRGVDELASRLIEADQKLAKRTMSRALRKAANFVRDDMKILAAVDEGVLRDSIIVKTGTGKSDRKKFAVIGPEDKTDPVTGQNPRDYAHFVEYGTAPHDLTPKTNLGKSGLARLVGRIVDATKAPGAQHPGTAAQPFVRPALDQNRSKVVDIFVEELGKSIERAVLKGQISGQ